MSHGPIVDRLLAAGALQPETLASLKAADTQSTEEALLACSAISPAELLAALSAHFGVRAALLDDEAIEEDARTLIPPDMITNCQILPLRREEGRLVLAMVDPSDVVAEDFARFVTGYDIERVAVFPFDLQLFLSGNRGSGASHAISEEELLSLPVLKELEDVREERIDGAAPGPVIRAVHAVLSEGVQQKASDIHFEPNGRGLRVRYRIDGYLKEVAELPKLIQQMVLSRLKLAAGLDITERRRPQDGRSRLQIGDTSVDFRVSTLPTYFGEKIVMRILDNRKGSVDITKSGMRDEDMRTFLDFLRQPLGIVLITGPTGSGKTTSLYGALTRIHTPDTNIVTVEDPVEYQISGINQVQVNVKAGLTFATALRAILRQDPDVVMVGEIRDLETASIAFESAMTGHLVFSTLHTNDAPSAITRLVHLGVPKYLITSSLLGVVAQRLVRRLCPHCKSEVALSPEKHELLVRTGLTRIPQRFYEGKGCGQCGQSGFSGRIGLFEIVRMTDAVRDLVFADASEQEVRHLARTQGTHVLLEDGLLKCEMGLTTIDEVLHVAPAGLEAGLTPNAASSPLPSPATPNEGAPPLRATQPAVGGRREGILVIEHDPDTRRCTQEILEAELFEVVTASGAQEGLQRAVEHQPDLIVTDFTLTDADGATFVRALQATTAGRHVPIVVLGGMDTPDEETRALEAGAHDFLTRPVDGLRLVQRVEAHLRRSHARRQAHARNRA